MPTSSFLEASVRGISEKQSVMLSLISPENRVPKDHPLRRIKAMADQELERMSQRFDQMYSHTGRPSIPPERVLKSLLLIVFYSVRSERQFCEQLDYNLLFRWSLDMNMVEESFDATVFTKNRERLMEHEGGRLFFDGTSATGSARGYLRTSRPKVQFGANTRQLSR